MLMQAIDPDDYELTDEMVDAYDHGDCRNPDRLRLEVGRRDGRLGLFCPCSTFVPLGAGMLDRARRVVVAEPREPDRIPHVVCVVCAAVIPTIRPRRPVCASCADTRRGVGR